MRILIIFIFIFCCFVSVTHAEEWKVYNDQTGDFTISYPPEWQVVERPNVIAIMSPRESPRDAFSENVTIVIDKSNARFLALNEYVDLELKELEKDTYFKLIERDETAISGGKAIFLISTGAGQGRGKSKQYIFGDSSSKYILTYTAEKDKYDKFLKQAEEIINSIKLSDQSRQAQQFNLKTSKQPSPLKKQSTTDTKEFSDFNLTATSASGEPGKRTALINGAIYHVGDSVAGYKVSEIKDGCVVLIDDKGVKQEIRL